MTAPMPAGLPPQGSVPRGTPQGPPPPPKPPWTPFQARPNDQEPQIAAIWARRLSQIISSTEYLEADPAWREPLDAKYKAAIQILTPPAPPAPPQGQPNG